MIIGLMRIKNEARWIERVLRSMLPICERILILDDNSTDDTPYICANFPEAMLFPSPFTGTEETRDKNWLLERLEEVAQPNDWIICIDGDEEIAPGGCERIRSVVKAPEAEAYKFQVLYLWDRPDQIRVDGIYASFCRPSMFRFVPGARFKSSAGGGFHCGNVPERPRIVGDCGVKLLHYGYLHREDRLRKYEWYTAPDKQPIPQNEDGYRHMIIGDLLPATTKTRHGGPLQLRSL